MNNTNIRSLYGLKYNPFLPDLPPDALYTIPGTKSFALSVQHMAAQGGFALITGDPGLGKSKTLQQIALGLEQIPDLTGRFPLLFLESGSGNPRSPDRKG